MKIEEEHNHDHHDNDSDITVDWYIEKYHKQHSCGHDHDNPAMSDRS